MIIALIFLSVICALLLLSVGWLTLTSAELRERMEFIDYSLNLSFYNDYIQNLNIKDELTPEEDFKIINMQEELINQARSLGFDIPHFQRPKGLD